MTKSAYKVAAENPEGRKETLGRTRRRWRIIFKCVRMWLRIRPTELDLGITQRGWGVSPHEGT
jgi:hypothetical protein